jgi:hypothetical protein
MGCASSVQIWTAAIQAERAHLVNIRIRFDVQPIIMLSKPQVA